MAPYTPTVTFLEFGLSDGGSEVVEVTRAGGSVRLGVGEFGHRGGVWRFRASPDKPEVFVEGELGEPHYSFHASGEAHQRFKSAAMTEEITGVRQKDLDEWRTAGPNEAGWTSAFTVWVPSEDVIDVPDDRQQASEVAWLPQPPPGDVMAIRLFFAAPDLGAFDTDGVAELDLAAAFQLSDGRAALVLANRLTPDEQGREQLRGLRARTRTVNIQSGIDTSRGAIRAMFYGRENETGTRCLFDLAARPCNRQGCPPQPN